MLERLAALTVRRPWRCLVLAILLVVLGGVASAAVFGKLSAGGFTVADSESAQAAELLQTEFKQQAPNLTLLVTAPDGVDSPAAAADGEALAKKLAAEPGVTDVSSYWTAGRAPQLRGEDGQRALVLGAISGDDTTVEKRIKTLQPEYQGEFGSLRVQVGGNAVLQHEMVVQGQEDATKGEALVFPVTLVLLVLFFGSVVAALIPLAVALVAMMICFGVMWLLASVSSLSSLAISIVTLLGLGLAIDYSLLFVNRYREELAAGRDIPNAIRITMGSAGRTVIFSAFTVAIALAGLIWFPLEAIRSMGYAGIATALIAGATSVTVLPALLTVLGPRVDKWRVRRRSATPSMETADGFWHRLATTVMRRPVPIATVVIIFLLLLGAPALGMKLGMPDERIMPESSSARQVADVIRSDFDTSGQNALLVVLPEAPSDRQAVADYAAALSALPNVAQVQTVTGSYRSGTQQAAAGPQDARFATDSAVYLTVLPTPAGVDESDALVTQVRETQAPFETMLTGVAATNQDSTNTIIDRLPYALGSIAVVMVVLLFMVTGSVLVPFLSLLLSLLSLTATFGALVWIFQDGHLSGLLGFTATGTLSPTVPTLLFGLSFGLAMDYQVFLLARIREEYDQTGDGTAAVAIGLERIGRIVTAAAVTIAVVFLAFIISGISMSKAFGIGLPLAVLMDATLIRGALLPATMRLFGKATWWAPLWLRRIYEGAALHRSVEEPLDKKPVAAG
ncbi:MMPL family transporter [Nocardia iowensis]|uniref:MMPL family transporter n=1 Tax=Nocardia iowensis TaxID=204891 RepID=A0ABX8RL63_NOCIO|nr:MMPL family transporter [Nocardia iowensis]QXN90066.1 MMPL family transporter [Nocardia iowensis]